jgi:signal peptidase I
MSDKQERKKRIRREKRRQRRRERSLKKFIKGLFGWFVAVLIAAILGYGLVVFCVQTVYMVGSSMSPTLSNEEKVYVNKVCYLLSAPERYDIVAYRSVDTPDEYYDIKRVIGLPGETVRIEDGKVYIDDKELEETPFDEYIFTAGLAETNITLGDNEYFLMGDNVNNSEDSRYLNVGNVKKSEMLGRIISQ